MAASNSVVFYFGRHDHRMFGLSGGDHLDGDLARVEKTDRAVEHVKGESLWAIGRLRVIIHSQLTGDKRGDRRFAQEFVSVYASVNDQAELRPVESTAV